MSANPSLISTTKTVPVRDKFYCLPRLDNEDISRVGDLFVAIREKIAKGLAEEHQLDKVDIYNICLDIRARKPTYKELLSWALQPEGVQNILKVCFEKGKVSPEDQVFILATLNTNEQINLSQALIWQQADEEKKPEDKVPLSGTAAGLSQQPNTPPQAPVINGQINGAVFPPPQPGGSHGIAPGATLNAQSPITQSIGEPTLESLRQTLANTSLGNLPDSALLALAANIKQPAAHYGQVPAASPTSQPVA